MSGRRWLARVPVAVGLACVAVATTWFVAAETPALADLVSGPLAVAVGGVAVLLALLRVWSRGDDAPTEPLVDAAPERTTRERPLAGREFAGDVEAAAATARRAGRVEAGVAELRPTLRETLVAVRTRAGDDPDAVRRDLDTGTWTDDPVAASVLSAEVDPPRRSLRRRIVEWVRPERVVRRRARRATGAVAAVARERLPTVPGRRAPRTAPVSRPSLDDLRRAADGTLQEAVDPGAVDDGGGVEP